MSGLSIITVSRNDMAGLRRTVDSILSQSSPPDELIIVDGDSTDGSREWLESTDWPAYVSWRSEPDAGIYDAMNKGLALRRGRGLIMFMNAGDWFAGPTALESIAASHRSHAWRWASGRSILVDGEGRVLREIIPTSPSRFLFMIGLAPVPHQAAVFTSELLDDVGWFDLDAGIAADQHHMLRCWLTAPPFALRILVSFCDATGVSSKAARGFTTRQMREYRLDVGRPLLRSSAADLAITQAAAAISSLTSVLEPQVRVRRLHARLRSLSR